MAGARLAGRIVPPKTLRLFHPAHEFRDVSGMAVELTEATSIIKDERMPSPSAVTEVILTD
ncbi:hypothetical protein DY251_18785 [Mesorhizobium denitrificans]|uniref:Uncharacterized protein n=1 Tax=Mesorhizobium denitrificans TaxID=2294114 RepID=A0A371X6F3_9HYPH|nr:hypothetical protein DY251_18785 [Mesorhizobium denitrificans]